MNSLYLINLAIASLLTCGVALLTAWLFRYRPATEQYRILMVGLTLCVVSPFAVAAASHFNIGTWAIAADDSQPTAAHQSPPSEQLEFEQDAPPTDPSVDIAPQSPTPQPEHSSLTHPNPPASSTDKPIKPADKSVVEAATAPAEETTPPTSHAQPAPADFRTQRSVGSFGWPIFPTIWSIGTIVLLIRLAIGAARVRAFRRWLTPAGKRIEAIAADVSSAAGTASTIPVYLSPATHVPLTFGLWHPCVVVPEGLSEQLNDDQLQAVLAHEVAHANRRDPLVSLAQRVVVAMLWWNPFLHAMSRRLHSLCETICDSWAVRACRSGRALATALLKVAEWNVDPRSPAHSLSLTGSARTLARRIMHLTNQQEPLMLEQPRPWRRMLAVVSLILLATAFLPALRTESAALETIAEEPAQPNSAPVLPAKEDPAATREKKAAGNVADQSRQRGPIITASSFKSLPDPGGISVIRGKVVGPAGVLPKKLKVRYRLSKPGFASWPKSVHLNRLGEFQITTTRRGVKATLFITSAETAPYKSKRIAFGGKPLPIRLSAGFPTRIQFLAADGRTPDQGKVTVTMRSIFRPDFGTFKIDSSGQIVIPHCGGDRLKLTVHAPGFGEQQVSIQPVANKVATVILPASAPATFRLLSAIDGKPIAGATVRFFARRRAKTYLKNLTRGNWGRVWTTSNKRGQVKLHSLLKTDPRPTSIPGKAEYAFLVTASGFAPHIVSGVEAGKDLGDIKIGKPLEIRGVIEAHAPGSLKIKAQWRQPTDVDGGGESFGTLTKFTGSSATGKIPFHIKGLRPGLFNLFIVYSWKGKNGKTLFRQIEFQAPITGSITGMRVSRNGVLTKHKHLGKRQHLFPAANLSTLAIQKIQKNSAIVWTDTAPMRHSGARRTHRIFVQRDGTVLVPDQGAVYFISQLRLRFLLAFITKQPETAKKSKEPAKAKPRRGRRGGRRGNLWTHGMTAVLVQPTAKDKPKVYSNHHSTGRSAAVERITKKLSALIVEASFGGDAKMREYLKLANQRLQKDSPETKPLTTGSYPYCRNEPDGTRQVGFFDRKRRVGVSILHPVGGNPYVTSVRLPAKR